MNNQNQLTAIQQRYPECNLLMPSTTEVQLNPFYKFMFMEVKADLSDNSGDIFKVGSVNTNGNWIDTFSPAKPLLMKLAAAAGIQFDPNNTYGTLISKNCYKAKAYGALRLPDGTGKTHCDEKIINLDDEEDRFRLEFMDKSIEGITDARAAKEAAKMFKGQWVDSKDKWDKPCKAFVIDDVDRQKYIDRSVLVNMTLLRKTAAEKAMTGAILRVVRALIGMKGQYTKTELAKPFVVSRVTFSPDYSDPEVRRAMLDQGMNAVGNMFGSASALPSAAMTGGVSDYAVPDSTFNPDEFAGNPAFTSDGEDPADDFNTPTHDDMPSEPAPAGGGYSSAPTTGDQGSHDQEGGKPVCSQCGREITEKIADFSTRKFGVPLCMKCQKEAE